ncbi:MAG: hypothetical protein ABIE22_03955 [archaeon]
MNRRLILSVFSILIILATLNFVSAVVVNADYIMLYPGEDGQVTIKVDNNENFDIESVSLALLLDEVPFSAVGSSERSYDDLDEDDDDTSTFKIRANNDITPGDYNIPYILKYTNLDTDLREEKTGSFGLRVSAETEVDFGVEVRGDNTDAAIVGQRGRITLEIINLGLGGIKSVSVEVFPQGYELLSADKVFIGNIDSDDTDIASFNVIFKNKNPSLSARVTFKDFDNKEQVELVNLPVDVYTSEEALQLGLIQRSKTGTYIAVVVVLVVLWFIYRSLRKRMKKKKAKEKNGA